MEYYNRYQNFLINGNQTVVPYLSIAAKPTDKKYVYIQNQSRLDKISQDVYGSPFFGWLILSANPNFGGLETNIPNGSVLIIPYPLYTSLLGYKNALDTHIFYYGR
jgi:hypothetical protein